MRLSNLTERALNLDDDHIIITNDREFSVLLSVLVYNGATEEELQEFVDKVVYFRYTGVIF